MSLHSKTSLAVLFGVMSWIGCGGRSSLDVFDGSASPSGTGTGTGDSSGSGSGSGGGADNGCGSPSCMPGGPGRTNCGPNSECCCTSPEVPGGTFNRDGNASYPATISGFRLDKYDVTVGRFRAFINAGPDAWKPAIGSGIHAHLNGGQGLVNSGTGGGYETGWQSGWTSATLGEATLASTPAQWATNLEGSPAYQTWQPITGNENLPINCVDWYEAYAFCIWDGGFLPSEAEFNYAFMGGSAENTYPWGSAPPGTSNQYAIYGCFWSSPGTGACTFTLADIAPVGSAPAGNGAWGQADLTGELAGRNLDWYKNPYSTASCNDCADTTDTASSTRMAPGVDWGSTLPGELLVSDRFNELPFNHSSGVGFRCARTP